MELYYNSSEFYGDSMDIVSLLIEKVRLLPNLFILYAPSILLAVAIFVLGRWIVRRLSGVTVKASQRVPNIDETLARFFGSIVLMAGTVAVVIAALAAMNINLAFLATIFAALVIALGFALQESLGDLASGVMLAFFRPYKVGEEVELAGANGVVAHLGIFSTKLITRDNIEITVGNGQAFGNTIKNYYAFGDRRLDMDCGVSYDADLNQAIKAILDTVKGDDRIRVDPVPWAKVTGLGDSAVNIQLRIWCDADQYRHVKMDMSQRIKAALDAAAIEIPYEHNMIIPMKAG